MAFIVLNKVLNNAGNSIAIELHRDNVLCIEPITIRVGGAEVNDRRCVGAQSRVHTGLPGLPYVDVLESAEMIRKLISGYVPQKERVLQPSMNGIEGLALVDTHVKQRM